MADIYIERTDTATHYKYLFLAISNISEPVESGVIDLTLPGETEPIILDLGGQKTTLKFNCVIMLRSDDTSMGTYGGAGIKTVKEQIAWLKQYIFSATIGSKWTLHWDDRLTTGGVSVTLKNISFYPRGAGQVEDCTFDMVYGETLA